VGLFFNSGHHTGIITRLWSENLKGKVHVKDMGVDVKLSRYSHAGIKGTEI
jgi:hypothetical protein